MRRAVAISLAVVAAVAVPVTPAHAAPDPAVRVSFSGGTLRITGTDLAESVRVVRAGERVVVTADREVRQSGQAPRIDAVQAVRIELRAGNDTVRILLRLPDVVVDGGRGNDVLIGGPSAEQLYGRAGKDSLAGGGGSDEIFGGNGDDVVRAGFGSDIVAGGAGADDLDGGSGGDKIDGGAGDDTLTGGDGRDTVRVAPAFGADTMTDPSEDDTVALVPGLSVRSGIGTRTVTIWDGADDQGTLRSGTSRRWAVTDFS